MRHQYRDIRIRIPEEIQWHDYHGVPRYTPFSPNDCPEPYAVEVLLMEIACQHCGKHFNVQLHNGPLGDAARLASEVKSGRIAYGEPPPHHCAGDVVTSRPLRILEFYMRQSGQEWKRDTGLEVSLQTEFAT